MKMKTTGCILVAVLALGFAGSAGAASKSSLTVGNRTVAGPGTDSLAEGGSIRVFTHANNSSDLCVTVVNTGKNNVGVSVTGATPAVGDVPAGGSQAVCSDDVTAIDLTCPVGNCTAQWRVDQN